MSNRSINQGKAMPPRPGAAPQRAAQGQAHCADSRARRCSMPGSQRAGLWWSAGRAVWRAGASGPSSRQPGGSPALVALVNAYAGQRAHRRRAPPFSRVRTRSARARMAVARKRRRARLLKRVRRRPWRWCWCAFSPLAPRPGSLISLTALSMVPSRTLRSATR